MRRDASRDVLSGFSVFLLIFFSPLKGYGGGTSEVRLMEAIRSASREEPQDLCIMTKFLPTFWRFRKLDLINAAKASRRRLGVSRIDVYFIHTPVHYRSVEFWIEACCDAVDAGLIDRIGLSNFNAEQVSRAHAVCTKRGCTIAANQVLICVRAKPLSMS